MFGSILWHFRFSFLLGELIIVWGISYSIPVHTITLFRSGICHRKHDTSVERLVFSCLFLYISSTYFVLSHCLSVFLTIYKRERANQEGSVLH